MRLIQHARSESALIQAIQRHRQRQTARTGVHCSDLVRSIMDSLFPRGPSTLDDSTILSLQEVGNAIEEVLAEQLQQMFAGWEKPTPRQFRGVWCSPDGWSPRSRCIDEIKVTWKWMGDFVTVDDAGVVIAESDKFLQYKLQTLFYGEAWGAARHRLHVLFINGTGRPPFPAPVTYVLKPTAEERQAVVDMMLQHGRDTGVLS